MGEEPEPGGHPERRKAAPPRRLEDALAGLRRRSAAHPIARAPVREHVEFARGALRRALDGWTAASRGVAGGCGDAWVSETAVYQQLKFKQLV